MLCKILPRIAGRLPACGPSLNTTDHPRVMPGTPSRHNCGIIRYCRSNPSRLPPSRWSRGCNGRCKFHLGRGDFSRLSCRTSSHRRATIRFPFFTFGECPSAKAAEFYTARGSTTFGEADPVSRREVVPLGGLLGVEIFHRRLGGWGYCSHDELLRELTSCGGHCNRLFLAGACERFDLSRRKIWSISKILLRTGVPGHRVGGRIDQSRSRAGSVDKLLKVAGRFGQPLLS